MFLQASKAALNTIPVRRNGVIEGSCFRWQLLVFLFLPANPHLKLQIALTWTIEGITLLTNTIWSDLSALLDMDIPLLSNSFYHQNFKSPTVY